MDKTQLLSLMVEAADDLDRNGLLKEADTITGIIVKVAAMSMMDAAQYLKSYPDLYQKILATRGDHKAIYNILVVGQHKGLTGSEAALYNAAVNMQKQQQRTKVQPAQQGTQPVQRPVAQPVRKASNDAPVKCDKCKESWDKDTPGYDEASKAIGEGKKCPACEGKE